MSYASTIFDLR